MKNLLDNFMKLADQKHEVIFRWLNSLFSTFITDPVYISYFKYE